MRMSSTYITRTTSAVKPLVLNCPLKMHGSSGQLLNPWSSQMFFARSSQALLAHLRPFMATARMAYAGSCCLSDNEMSPGSLITTFTPGGRGEFKNAVETSKVVRLQSFWTTKAIRERIHSPDGVAEEKPKLAASPLPAATCCTTSLQRTPGFPSISFGPITQRVAMGLILWVLA